MSKLESLIAERNKELQELEDNRGTRFPMIERATDIQIAYITKELSDLEGLLEPEKISLNENQKIVLEYMKSAYESQKNKGINIYEIPSQLYEEDYQSPVRLANCKLRSHEQLEVLQAFAEWGLGHEKV